MPVKNHISAEFDALKISLPVISMPEMELPDGYFESLGDEIVARIKSEQFLATLPSATPFSVPEQYFEQFSNEIAAVIHADNFLTSLPAATPFEVPDLYFATLSEDIVKHTQSELFIASLPKQLPYLLPDNYFENLTGTVISRSMKVNKISPLRATRAFYSKMSIAASLFIILSLGFLFMTHKPARSIETELAYVSDSEINSYIQEHEYEFENHLSYQAIDESKIDVNKLENEILNEYFDEISEEELNNYL